MLGTELLGNCRQTDIHDSPSWVNLEAGMHCDSCSNAQRLTTCIVAAQHSSD